MFELQSRMGYSFRRQSLLAEALTHSSYANQHRLPSNERLEFLGDRVLSLIIADHLFHACPMFSVGQLHTVQCTLEKNKFLAQIAKQLQVEKSLRFLGTSICPKPSENMLADLVEALIGAIFLDGGITEAKAFIARHFHFKAVESPLLSPQIEEAL